MIMYNPKNTKRQTQKDNPSKNKLVYKFFSGSTMAFIHYHKSLTTALYNNKKDDTWLGLFQLETPSNLKTNNY